MKRTGRKEEEEEDYETELIWRKRIYGEYDAKENLLDRCQPREIFIVLKKKTPLSFNNFRTCSDPLQSILLNYILIINIFTLLIPALLRKKERRRKQSERVRIE